MTAHEIRALLSASPRRTPLRVYLQAASPLCLGEVFHFHGGEGLYLLLDEREKILPVLQREKEKILRCRIETDRVNSALPLLDLSAQSARIEPGAILRQGVTLGKGVVVMMGAVLNVGASVGEGSMIDMNAVLGARAAVGRNCHIGAGAVLAGVLEPPSAKKVTVGDGVLVGANAVLLEGVTVGDGAVVAAGAVVTGDIPPETVAAGVPARIVKRVDDRTRQKSAIDPELRE